MKRWVVNIITVVSLVLCIGMCWLWVRSYGEFDAVRWLNRTGGDRQDDVVMLEVYSGKGVVEFDWDKHHSFPSDPGMPWRRVFHVHVKHPRGPEDRSLWSGWRKSFGGFGMAHDWVNANQKKNCELQFEEFKRVPAGRYENFSAIWQEAYRAVWVPHWFLAALLAILPLRWMWLWRRMRQRARGGMCVKCGYDLREGGERCSECGTLRMS